MELQCYICGGRLIPLNKKDHGIRPLVVGELFRAIVAKMILKEAETGLSAMQPTQVGVGGKGPVIQAAILTVDYNHAQGRDNFKNRHCQCI